MFYCNSCHFTNCLKIVTGGYSGKLFLMLCLDKENFAMKRLQISWILYVNGL